MAAVNPAPNPTLIAKAAGQRLLIDTGRMTVRRVTKNEGAILSALKTLAPNERSTLATFVDMLQARKRKHAPHGDVAAATAL